MEPRNTTISIDSMLQRLRQGDPGAGAELLDRSYERLRHLAGVMLRGSFPRLMHDHDPDSIAHEGWIRLRRTFDSLPDFPTPADFFRFISHKLRQVLLDLVERQDRDARVGFRSEPGADTTTGYSSDDPARLAIWTELHERLRLIPDDEHTVFALRYYLGMTNQEIAEGLGWHPKQVSRLWIAATERLADLLPTGPEP